MLNTPMGEMIDPHQVFPELATLWQIYGNCDFFKTVSVDKYLWIIIDLNGCTIIV